VGGVGGCALWMTWSVRWSRGVLLRWWVVLVLVVGGGSCPSLGVVWVLVVWCVLSWPSLGVWEWLWVVSWWFWVSLPSLGGISCNFEYFLF
jgi:hypothetical protein